MRKTVDKLFLFTITINAAFYFSAHAQEYQLGSLSFEASGDEVAMPYFVKGMLLLHNFEYLDAAQEFEMAQLLDPNLVMAYWGEAMCYNHPLWFQQDYEKGKGALFKLGVKADERLSKAKTDVEKGLISSIDKLYEEGENYETRNENYEQAMAELYSQHPTEEEVAAFYALSVLGNCYTNVEQDKYDIAARVLMKLNAVNPSHPGALNYMIHLYDAPSRGYKGRKAADAYFALAKSSKYAQHAPSHIYMATGDWSKYVDCNEASWKAAEAWVKKKKKSLEDRDYHSLWWLQYGYLQQGKYSKAMELLTNMNRDARYSRSERMRFHLAMMRGHYMSETGKWLSDVSRIEIPTNGFSVSTKNMCFFVDAMTAIEKQDLPKVDWYLNQMRDQRMVEQNKKEAYKDFRTYSITPIVRSEGLEQELMLAEIMEWELQALKAIKLNKLEEAEGFIKKAIELGDKTYYQSGPPVVLKPAHELYGEILLAMNNSTDAVIQFDLALQRAPGRSLSLLGKYKALKNLGETEKASEVKIMLLTNWKEADEQVKLTLE